VFINVEVSSVLKGRIAARRSAFAIEEWDRQY
jgi:hypothetical protein